MRHLLAFVGGTFVVAAALPAAGQMMMNPAYGMGGAPGTMVNLVSPADSPTQITRGTLMISVPSRRGASPSYVSLVLRLSGVTNSDGRVTSTDNVLLLKGQLRSATGSVDQEFTIDQNFDVKAGVAFVRVNKALPSLNDQVTLLIDQVEVLDAHGTLAAPGIVLASPATAPPGTTQGAPCTQQSDCDDGNPNTQEVCTLFGCHEMPMSGMFPGTVPTPGSGPGTGMHSGSRMSGGMMQ